MVGRQRPLSLLLRARGKAPHPWPLATLGVVSWPKFFQPLASLERVGSIRLLETTGSENFPSRSSLSFILTYYFFILEKDKNLFFFRHYFLSLTSVDVEWPWIKTILRGEELCLYLYFVYVRQSSNLSFSTFFHDFLPSVTFHDLETNFYSRFVTSDDLLWPHAYF